ncbi:MAG: ABC transporter permease [Rhodobacteraceae bacterium]|nr:ABC transporter permease [Paracoccaceae bacterium]
MIALTSPVETPAHHWPAGLKLAALCIVTLILFAVEGLLAHLAFLAATALLFLWAGWRFARAGLVPLWQLWPFVVLILLWHLLAGETAEGVEIVLRMLTAVALATFVTMTTTLSEMMAVVHWLTTPLRRCGLRTRPMELAVAMVVRFAPALILRGNTLRLAWRARSARPVGWRIVMPMAVLAIDDAEQVALALRARGGLGSGPS